MAYMSLNMASCPSVSSFSAALFANVSYAPYPVSGKSASAAPAGTGKPARSRREMCGYCTQIGKSMGRLSLGIGGRRRSLGLPGEDPLNL